MGKYEEALERAKQGLPIDEVFPELKECEDERIRKLLVWQVYRNIEDETNDLAQSVYDGIKGHDPDLEESIEDWKKCLAYLEKQKGQKPLSTEETELNSIAFLEQLGYTCIPPGAEQKPVEIHIDNPNIQKFDPDVKVTTSDSSADGKELLYVSNKSYDIGFRDGVASVKPAEWGEEDEKMLRTIISDGSRCVELDSKQIDWLKSLRPQPHWKPSEEQIEVFFKANPVNLMPDELAVYHSLCSDLKKL